MKALFILIFISTSLHADELRSNYGPYFLDETKKILLCSYQTDFQNPDVGPVGLKTEVLKWGDWENRRVIKIHQGYTMKVFFLDKAMVASRDVYRISQFTYFADDPGGSKDIGSKIDLFGKKFRKEEVIPKVIFVQHHDLKISADGIEMRESCGIECSKVVLIDEDVSGDLTRFCPKDPEGA